MDEPETEPDIRPARPDDTPRIHRLIAGVYAEYGMTLVLEDAAERHLLDPGGYFRASGGEFWVAMEGEDRLLGTVALLLHPEGGELKSLYVHRSARRRGLGRFLVRRVIDAAREAGRRRFFLWSDTRFVQAHALYRSLGLVEFGVRDIEDSNASREIGFERDLFALQ